MRHIITIVAILILVYHAPVFAGSVPSKGPLNFTGQTPLEMLRLDIVPTRLHVLRAGEVEISQFSSWTNRWNQTSEYLLDVEVIQNIFTISTGIGHRMEIGLSAPILTRFGGHLDNLITSFHNIMGLGQAGRDKYPANSILVRYVDRAGDTITILNKSNQGTVLGDISFLMRYRLYRGTGFVRSLLISGLLRFPTSFDRTYYGSNGTDGALSLTGAYKVSPVYIYTTIGYGVYGSRSLLTIDLRPYQWTLFTAIEWPMSRKISLVIQEMTNSGTTESDNGFSRPTHELVMGIKHRLSKKLLIEYGLMENLFIFDNSNDFGFNFGMVYSL